MPEYDELTGELGPHFEPSGFAGSKIAFTDLTRGSAVSRPAPGIWLKYVARGAVAHTFHNRTFLVRAGEFLFTPELQTSEVEVRSRGESSTLGLCLFLSRPGLLDAHPAEEPLIFSARCSSLGRALAAETAEIARYGLERRRRAPLLLHRVEQNLDAFLAETAEQLEALPALKSGTRHEVLRRLNLARGYLHGVTDRPVALEELSRAAGMSRFQLLRQFKVCFGDPPGAYHRKLRLQHARAEVERSGLPARVVAQRYGFPDGSSFSHAYRRAFGRAPLRAAG